MTHTAKHTPGPWKAVQHPREHKWAWTIEGADGVVQSIARMGLVDDAQSVAANAHLIAAAPAMYEAIKAALDYYRGVFTGNTVTDEMMSSKLEQALAQAEGRDK